MSGLDDAPDADWKQVVRGLKTKIDPDRKALIEKVIREVAGDVFSLRAARKRLFLLLLDVLGGKPRLIGVQGEGVVVAVALGDLLELLAEPAPSLGEVLDAARRGRNTRGRRAAEA